MSYILSSLIGAVTVSGIKFLSDRASPEIAAILGAAPIGYMSTLLIKTDAKTVEYLTNYAMLLTFTVAAAVVYIAMLRHTRRKLPSLFSGLALLITCVLARLFINRKAR